MEGQTKVSRRLASLHDCELINGRDGSVLYILDSGDKVGHTRCHANTSCSDDTTSITILTRNVEESGGGRVYLPSVISGRQRTNRTWSMYFA